LIVGDGVVEVVVVEVDVGFDLEYDMTMTFNENR